MADASDNNMGLSQKPRLRGRPLPSDPQQRILRRREQLRIAQRAYRTRKEDTINDLTERVKELECGIQELSKFFLSISKKLLDTKAPEKYPHIALALHKATQQCLVLARVAQDAPIEDVSDDEDRANTAGFPKRGPVEQPGNHEYTEQHQQVPSDLPSKAPKASTKIPLDRLLGWVVTSPRTPALSIERQATIRFDSTHTDSEMSFLSPRFSLPLVTHPFIPPDEKTLFMQHLVRRCCLIAYELLVSHSDIQRIQEVFGSILPALSRNQMIMSLYNSLQTNDTGSVQRQAKVLTSLRSGEIDFTAEPTDALSRALEYAFDPETGAEWVDVYGVQELLSEKDVRFQEHIVTRSDGTGGKSDSSPSPHLDTTAFIEVLSSKAVCVCPGPVFRRQAVENAVDLAIANYRTVHDSMRGGG
ncbi:hypothetical protein PCG10_003792 [Penicillium crustosum]|uniref:BZIP domain-containing protein n=1 Tax=Penicillium crustosum TaxID=36656 RepID=A0A9P5L519_PENCR|nr:hypothetical protein PCG10_003792 [Penicillium crustosum]